ncbi:MAG: UDP-N-acetylmuramoyl-L-alanine--D-glutamate ligase [Rhodobacteraceae bacterium]|nr:UDP-N-acetylmuramoyl-L-alanine--D-glutamate ligase [Paracoccaceae bacterium]
MRQLSDLKGVRVGVLGLGRSGLSVAAALRDAGAIPALWDDSAQRREAAAALGFEAIDLADPGAEPDCALYVVSPGVPHLYPAPHPALSYALRRAIPLDNDISLFFRELRAIEREYLRELAKGFVNDDAVDDPAFMAAIEWFRGGGRFDEESQNALFKAAVDGAIRVVAVTGSNGKSTTSALIHHILTIAGVKTSLRGNIGHAVFDGPAPAPSEVVVLELSSYQLELARFLSPDVAVLTNISPDHLDRHGGLGGYVAAKACLFENAKACVIGVDEQEGLFLANRHVTRAPVTAVSTEAAPEAFPLRVTAKEGFVRFTAPEGEEAEAVSWGLSAARALQGVHNAQNAGCAAAACQALGLSVEAIQAGIDSFPGLPHRMQVIAEKDGVLFVNDSKATNADAAARSLATYQRVRWIVGGVAKEGGIESLSDYFPRIAKAYLIGASSDVFSATLGVAGVALSRCETLESAVAAAAADSAPGETVLLAPACASFDQFPDFEKRGEAFVAAVNKALG